jgi:hypothetical protein
MCEPKTLQGIINTLPEVLLQVRSQAALWALGLNWGNPADAASATYALQGWDTVPVYVGTLVVLDPINKNVHMSNNVQ